MRDLDGRRYYPWPGPHGALGTILSGIWQWMARVLSPIGRRFMSWQERRHTVLDVVGYFPVGSYNLAVAVVVSWGKPVKVRYGFFPRDYFATEQSRTLRIDEASDEINEMDEHFYDEGSLPTLLEVVPVLGEQDARSFLHLLRKALERVGQLKLEALVARSR